MKRHLLTAALSVSLSLALPLAGLAAWQQDGDGWRYGADGAYASDAFLEIDGNTYHFSPDGNMDTGWVELGGSWYYFAPGGQMAIGEQVVGDTAYTFSGDGRLLHEGIRRDGLEGDLLSAAFVKTHENWPQSLAMLEMMNREREQNGSVPLTLDFGLSLIATYRAAHMDRYNYFSHYYNNSNEKTCISNWKAYSGIDTELGEISHIYGDTSIPNNGIVNQESPEEFTRQAFDAYVDSPRHYRVILTPHATKTGIGFFRNQFRTRDYNVVLFGY